MDIVIIANFCGSLNGTENSRFLYLADLLAKEHAVEVITTDFDHASKSYPQTTAEFPFRVTRLHESGYPKNICLRRFASHWVWGRNVAAYLKNRARPDVVYCAVPSLSAPAAAADYCRRHNIPFIVDVQDLWPEAFQMVLNIPVVSDVIFAPFRMLADKIYRQADGIAAVSESYCRRILQVNRKCKEGHPVFLGTRLRDFDRAARAHPHSNMPAGRLHLAYCGTLGSSYDLTVVFDALALLRKRDVEIPEFVIMGDGPRKETFEQHAARLELPVRFTGRLPYAEMCGLLCACDMTVNPIIGKSVASIINKHADYAASGLPVINTQESPEYRALVDHYAMGINCPCGDAAAVADALERLVNNEGLRREMGANARRCAEERFDREHSYRELAALVETIAAK